MIAQNAQAAEPKSNKSNMGRRGYPFGATLGTEVGSAALSVSILCFLTKYFAQYCGQAPSNTYKQNMTVKISRPKVNVPTGST